VPRPLLLGLLSLALSLVPAAASAEAGPAPAATEGGPAPFIDLETGGVSASSNVAQVPGDTGTRFTLAAGDFATRIAPFVRVQAGARFGRHTLYATIAPLRLQGNGRSSAPIVFRDQTFTASEAASARYQLDTYRLTWRYAAVSRTRFELALGATAQVRDAAIRLAEPGHSTVEQDVRFLPLASLRMAGNLGGPFWLTLDGDGIVLPHERAEDVEVALEFRAGEVAFRAGYRLVEGGVDSSHVYNFAWLNHLVVGVRYEL
jgi:hypothetical protein